MQSTLRAGEELEAAASPEEAESILRRFMGTTKRMAVV
jgi:hypothetical protein